MDLGVWLKRPIIRIERGTAKHVNQLARVFTDSFGPITPADIRRTLKRKDFHRERFVAVVDGVVAANITLLDIDLLINGLPLKTIGIAAVATRWDYRRRGFATMLLDRAIERAKERGISVVALFTGVNFPAKRIYERAGFTETKRWIRYQAVRDPTRLLERFFEWRSQWLVKTSYGRAALRVWRERVLFASGNWRATVTCDGKKFRVQAGKIGKPTVTVTGPIRALNECFGNRLAYDGHVKLGSIHLTGSKESLALLRRFVTLEWVE